MSTHSLFLLLLVLFFANSVHSEANPTQAYFFAPSAASHPSQVPNSLRNVNIPISKTVYSQPTATYTLTKVDIQSVYNQGKQKVTIVDEEIVQVSGGRIEFTYNIDWEKAEGGKSVVRGKAYGSVLSDSLNYSKMLKPNSDGYVEWYLIKSENLTIIENPMKLKRMEPYNETDKGVIEQILDRAFQLITPANIETQILSRFNADFFKQLADQLNHEILGQNISYEFQSGKGLQSMNIVHHNYGLNVTPSDGFSMVFLTEISGYLTPNCNISVRRTHDSFQRYGNVQQVHLTCLYQLVADYLQSRGWLDTVLSDDWQVNAFQFYAGDLYDIVSGPSFANTVSPFALLEGECSAKPGVVFKTANEYDTNTYSLGLTYSCTIRSTSKQGQPLVLFKFTAPVKFFIKVSALPGQLDFTILEADMLSLSFQPGAYPVSNLNLALFKANQVLLKMKGRKVFGTGFKTVVRGVPRVEVQDNYVIYYDSSHYDMEDEEGVGVKMM